MNLKHTATSIRLKDGSYYEVPPDLMVELEKNYFDVERELSKMRMWSIANPDKCKTPRGIKRFIVGWFEGWGGMRPSKRRPNASPMLAIHFEPRPITQEQRSRNRANLDNLRRVLDLKQPKP